MSAPRSCGFDCSFVGQTFLSADFSTGSLSDTVSEFQTGKRRDEGTLLCCRVAVIMESPSQTARDSTSLLLAVARLLPVGNREDLLPGLAQLWQEATVAEAVLLIVPVAALSGIQAGYIAGNGTAIPLASHESLSITAIDPPRTDTPISSTLLSLFGESVDLSAFQAEKTQVLTIGEPPAGGVAYLASPTRDVLPELPELTAALIRQAYRNDNLQYQLQKAQIEQKLEALGEFAAGAGHEVNNPLATITGRVELLLRDETDPERRRSLATIGGQALRVRDMIGDVMLFARPPAPQPKRVDFCEAVQQVIAQHEPIALERNCRFSANETESICIHADPHQLHIVITNLLRNSLEAIPDSDGEIQIAYGRCLEDSPMPMAEFTVTDNGCGLSDLDREHVFDPFYSGRQAGRGLGFGLCKCHRIVSNHGGRIAVESSEDHTVFRVFWPLAEE